MEKTNSDGSLVCTLNTNTIYNAAYDFKQTVNRMNWFHLAQDSTSSGWSSMQYTLGFHKRQELSNKLFVLV